MGGNVEKNGKNFDICIVFYVCFDDEVKFWSKLKEKILLMGFEGNRFLFWIIC